MRWNRQGWWLVGTLLLIGCATLRQIAALRLVEFALGAIRGGSIAGVDLSRIRSYSDLRASEVARIAGAVARKDLPLEFILDLEATNPAANQVTARMVRMQWTLLIEDKETVHGVIDSAVALPPGEPRTIPMTVRLNLVQFFSGTGPDLVNLALAIAGARSEPTKVSLRALPTVETPLGPIDYPSPITIVSRTVGGRD